MDREDSASNAGLDSGYSGIIDLGRIVFKDTYRAVLDPSRVRATPRLSKRLMQLDAIPYLRQQIGQQLKVELDEPFFNLSDDMVIANLSGMVDLLRTDKGLLVSLSATGTAPQVCSRCLAEIEYTLRIAFREVYRMTVDISTRDPVRMADDPDTFLIGPDFVLDLDEAIRQYGLTAEPPKPLCRPDCPGLDLPINNGPSAHAEKPDARWGALAGLANTLWEKERS